MWEFYEDTLSDNFENESGDAVKLGLSEGGAAGAPVAELRTHKRLWKDELMGMVSPRVATPQHRKFSVIVLGLAGHGKTHISNKLSRFLSWLGHPSKMFRAQGLDLTDNDVAANEMLEWMHDGGQVGFFVAGTVGARAQVKMLLETKQEQRQIARNEIDEAREAYLTLYEPLSSEDEDLDFISLVDMIVGQGSFEINRISGYLPSKLMFFLMNVNARPKTIWLTRHGESEDNKRKCIGGDSKLSNAGERYAVELSKFLQRTGQKRPSNRPTSVWTSSLERTIQTASAFPNNWPQVKWKALDELHAGICDGMTYDKIRRLYPDDYKSRKEDKLMYRYTLGESYLDVIHRLETVIVETERHQEDLVIISHQAVLRCLLGYFQATPLADIPYLPVPLHSVIELESREDGSMFLKQVHKLPPRLDNLG